MLRLQQWEIRSLFSAIFLSSTTTTTKQLGHLSPPSRAFCDSATFVGSRTGLTDLRCTGCGPHTTRFFFLQAQNQDEVVGTCEPWQPKYAVMMTWPMCVPADSGRAAQKKRNMAFWSSDTKTKRNRLLPEAISLERAVTLLLRREHPFIFVSHSVCVIPSRSSVVTLVWLGELFVLHEGKWYRMFEGTRPSRA